MMRQGDPLSLLFIIVIEALNLLLEKAKELDMLKGFLIGGSRTPIEISHVFFVDDTPIFCQPEITMLLNL